MMFCIQASNPYVKKMKNPEDEKIFEAMETIFPLWTEESIMRWNNITIPLGYKYEVSYMVQDVLYILNQLRMSQKGEIKMHWLPDTFRSDWFLCWENGNLEIDSKWFVVRSDEEALNRSSKVSISISDFANEWKQLLGIVIDALTISGYTSDDLEDMGMLLEEYDAIKGKGVLYQD